MVFATFATFANAHTTTTRRTFHAVFINIITPIVTRMAALISEQEDDDTSFYADKFGEEIFAESGSEFDSNAEGRCRSCVKNGVLKILIFFLSFFFFFATACRIVGRA